MTRWGSVVATYLGGLVASYASMSYAFLLQGAFSLAAGLMVLSCLGCRHASAGDIGQQVKREPVRSREVWRQHWRLLLGSGTFGAAVCAVREAWKVYVALVGARPGLSVTEGASVISMGRLIEGIVFPIGGLMTDKMGRLWVAVPSIIFMGMSFVPPFFGSISVVSLIGWNVPFSIGNGIGAGIVLTMGADLAPANARSEFLAAWRVVTSVGMLLGPFLVGVCNDQIGLENAGWCWAGFCLLSAGWMLLHRNQECKAE